MIHYRCFLAALFILITYTAALAQQAIQDNSIYSIEDSVPIPTRRGMSISAIVVRHKATTAPLPAILFYTTCYQGAGDAAVGKKSADRAYVGVEAYARGIKTDFAFAFPATGISFASGSYDFFISDSEAVLYE